MKFTRTIKKKEGNKRKKGATSIYLQVCRDVPHSLRDCAIVESGNILLEDVFSVLNLQYPDVEQIAKIHEVGEVCIAGS